MNLQQTGPPARVTAAAPPRGPSSQRGGGADFAALLTETTARTALAEGPIPNALPTAAPDRSTAPADGGASESGQEPASSPAPQEAPVAEVPTRVDAPPVFAEPVAPVAGAVPVPTSPVAVEVTAAATSAESPIDVAATTPAVGEPAPAASAPVAGASAGALATTPAVADAAAPAAPASTASVAAPARAEADAAGPIALPELAVAASDDDQASAGDLPQAPPAPASAPAAPSADLPAPTAPQSPLAPAATTVAPSAPAVPAQAAPVVQAAAPTLSHAGMAAAVDRIEDLVRVASLRDGNARATMQLRPAELGRVDVLLRTTAVGLIATIRAHDQTGLVALQQAGADLQRTLADRGVEIARLDLQLASGDQPGQRRDPRDAGAGATGSGFGRGSGAATAAALDPIDAGDEIDAVAVATTTTLPDGVLVDVRA